MITAGRAFVAAADGATSSFDMVLAECCRLNEVRLSNRSHLLKIQRCLRCCCLRVRWPIAHHHMPSLTDQLLVMHCNSFHSNVI